MKTYSFRVLLCLAIILLAAPLAAQDNSLTVDGRAELVFGFDTYSLASGFDVFGAATISYSLNSDGTATMTGDQTVKPYAELGLKGITVGGGTAWDGSSTDNDKTEVGSLSMLVAFDYAKLVYSDFYLMLYGADNLFELGNAGMAYSFQRKAQARLLSEFASVNFRNKRFYQSVDYGFVNSSHDTASKNANLDNIFSIGYSNAFIGTFELLIASNSSWLKSDGTPYSKWGGSDPYLDNRNAYTLGLDGSITALLDMELSFSMMHGFGYMVEDSTIETPNKTAAGLGFAYTIYLGDDYQLIPRLGVDVAYDRTVYPDEFTVDFSNTQLSTSGSLQFRWPGSYDEVKENPFIGKQWVFSGTTVSYNWTPDENSLTDGMKLGVSLWEDSGEDGLLPIPLGFAVAYEAENFTSDAPKMDLMSYVDYKFGAAGSINPYLGVNYAFKNREWGTLDSEGTGYESNTLDVELGVYFTDIVLKADYYFKYRTGELLPGPDQLRDFGIVTTGLVIKY